MTTKTQVQIIIGEEGRGTILTWERVTVGNPGNAGYIVGHIRDNAGYYAHAPKLLKVHWDKQCNDFVMIDGHRHYITGPKTRKV